jgi:lipopolysaccharide export system protein LptA
MFRRARWLVLLALVVVTAFTAGTYLIQRKAQRQSRPRRSAPLPANISATADYWTWELKQGEHPKVSVKARSFRQVKEPSAFLLEGVEMRVYAADGGSYSLVNSARASFDTGTGELYSDGEVDIHTSIADGGKPSSPPMHIRSSGVHFDARTTKVWTERPASFVFDKGDGTATGASYDPKLQELTMNSNVVLHWRGAGPVERQMVIETGHLVYHEIASDIYLTPTARLTRGAFTLDAGPSVVTLKDGELDRLDAQQARGADRAPKRNLSYDAAKLFVFFAGGGEIRKIEGLEGAHLVSESPAGSTVVTSNRVDLDFVSKDGESQLTRALGTGKARVESTPAKRPNGLLPPVRVLTSEVIELLMRPGGEQISQVSTHSPAEVEFIPRREGDKRRKLNGERLTIRYAGDNMVDSIEAVDVVTRTETPKKGAKPSIATTRSKSFQSTFDPVTGQMTRIEQWPDFEYEEGALRARASKATLDSAKEIITLDGAARMWDPTGSTSADLIVLQQATGDLLATGHVASTRMPDATDKSSGGMLDSRQPIQARAQRMEVTRKHQLIRYDGDVLLWQGGSRLRAHAVDIDRDAGRLTATGDVSTLIPDDRGGNAKPKPGATSIRSASLVYDDKPKLAHYTGSVALERPNMDLTSQQLRVWFREEKDSKGAAGSSLDRMFADGGVTVVERGPKAAKTGSSEHGEYYPGEERMVLTGGNPLVTDRKRGATRGNVITWLVSQDRLIVDNTGSGPAVSRILSNERK